MHHFKYCLISRKRLEEACESLNLAQKKAKLEVKTRWGSTLTMIERYLIIEPAFMQLYRMSKSMTSKDPLKDKILEDNILYNKETELLQSLTKILKEIEIATQFLGQNRKPCISEVLITMNGLLLFFDDIIRGKDEQESSNIIMDSDSSSNHLIVNSILVEFVQLMQMKMNKVNLIFIHTLF